MTAAEYYYDVSARLRQARCELQRAKDELRTSDAADLLRLVQVLTPEVKEAYQRWIDS